MCGDYNLRREKRYVEVDLSNLYTRKLVSYEYNTSFLT